MLKHSLAFGVSTAPLVVKSVLLLDATSLEVTAVNLRASNGADISRILSTVSMPNNLCVFLAHLAARIVSIDHLDLLSWHTNRSTFLVRHILHSFLETHASFGHIRLFNDSIIGLVDHLLLISSLLWLLGIVVSLHAAIESGSCLHIRLVDWIDSIVSAQVCSLIVKGLSRVTHAHVHLLLDTVGNAVVTLRNVIRINTSVPDLWTQRIAIRSSSRFGLKLVFVDDSIVLVSGILHLSIYQHIIILLDHISLERVVAYVLTDLTIWREPIHLSTVLVRLELTAGALLA